jgi:hypothetical protein
MFVHHNKGIGGGFQTNTVSEIFALPPFPQMTQMGYRVSCPESVLYTLDMPPNNREIDVFAYKGLVQVLEFHFLPRTGAQTAAQNCNGAWLMYESGGTSYHSQSGTLTQTTCDTTSGRIEGTFNFVGLQSGGLLRRIKEGNLSVTRLTKQ